MVKLFIFDLKYSEVLFIDIYYFELKIKKNHKEKYLFCLTIKRYNLGKNPILIFAINHISHISDPKNRNNKITM